MLATTLMTTLLIPLAGAAPAPPPPPQCVASADSGATPLPGDPTLYVREYKAMGQTHVELWREANGVAGLQPDPSWNCGHPGDELLDAVCFGCPTVL
jgi:hypothetical protein